MVVKHSSVTSFALARSFRGIAVKIFSILVLRAVSLFCMLIVLCSIRGSRAPSKKRIRDFGIGCCHRAPRIQNFILLE